METVSVDYAPKGVKFFYIYKPLAHPELNNYISPFTIEERLMHVKEAERRLGSSITWLADTMDNVYHDAMGQTPNSELVIGPDGLIAARRAWSNPEALRVDLERLVGPVENPTTVAELDLPTQPPPPTVVKGVVPRVPLPEGAMPMEMDPIVPANGMPFYAKLRAEGTPTLFETGTGTMYLGFHLDPLYRVHWNNEVDPVEFEITAPPGVTVTPSSGVAPDPEEPADADPREWLVEVEGKPGDTLDLRVRYYACDDALTFCIPARQDYRIHLARDLNHAWTIRMSPDGTPLPGGGPSQ